MAVVVAVGGWEGNGKGCSGAVCIGGGEGIVVGTVFEEKSENVAPATAARRAGETFVALGTTRLFPTRDWRCALSTGLNSCRPCSCLPLSTEGVGPNTGSEVAGVGGLKGWGGFGMEMLLKLVTEDDETVAEVEGVSA